MSSEQPSVAEHERTITELATGFAIGELDDTELKRFYDLLREPGARGADAARVAWQVLGTTIDLRASLGTRFQDTIKHRVEHGAGEANQGFVGGIMARLGFERRKLRAVTIPVPEPRWRLPWLIALSALVAVLVMALWPAGSDGGPHLARITAVHGAVTREGSFVTEGQRVDGRPLVLAEGSSVDLMWHSEAGSADVLILGPAKLVPRPQGLSLLSGRAAVSSLVPFALGLPDRLATIAAHSQVVVEVHDAGSMLAVAQGLALLGQDKQPNTSELHAGEAIAGTSTPFRWVQEAELSGDGAERFLETDTNATSWTLAFGVSFTGSKDAVELSTDGDGATRIRLEPGKLTIIGWEQTSVLEIPGPPLREWRLVLRARPGQSATASISGADLSAPLPDNRLPTVFRFSGGAGIATLQHHTGPEPIR
ncbi:MAG: hypothetical protein PF961_12870 [Planctomycetota bacterium]|jgi:hypothetical protein|nr:hypothetical protein [Planctomycetota bacterium]